MKKIQFSFVLSGYQIYFDFLSLTDHQKRNRKSWKIHMLSKSGYNLCFAKFHTEIQWWKSIHCEPTCHNCHTELPYDLSEQHRCIIRSQLCSLCNIKIHFLIPILTVHCLQVWHMMRESVSHSPRIRQLYPMPCNIFCKAKVHDCLNNLVSNATEQAVQTHNVTDKRCRRSYIKGATIIVQSIVADLARWETHS